MDKVSKKEAEYTDEGTRAEHCGPVMHWPEKGQCHHFLGHRRCERVTGLIARAGWCRFWLKRAYSRGEEA